MSDSVLETLEIQLADGPSPIYKGGEIIRGKIHIRLRKNITIFSVRLQIKGRAAWMNDPMKKADIEKVYFDQDMALLERPPGKPDPHHFQWIANFDYHLPFEMPLPRGCPTSFEGPHGFIRYFIKAALVEEDGSELREYFVKNAFSIVAPSDGSIIRGEGVSAEETVGFGKCCCKGKVKAELSLPQTGYLPGENVYGHLKVDNKKPKDILNQMEVRLVDRVLRVGAPDKTAASPFRTLFYRKLEHVPPVKGQKGFENNGLFLLTIPPVPPTTLESESPTCSEDMSGDFDNITDDMHILTPAKGLLESPSTATLRFRKVPFLRVEYAIQVSLGTHILLEVPIQIGELKTHDSNTILRPFVAGPQPIEEADEAGKIAFNGPFTYTPMYPYVEPKEGNGANGSNAAPKIPTINVVDLEKQKELAPQNDVAPSQVTIVNKTSNPDEHTTVVENTTTTEATDGSHVEKVTTTVTKIVSGGHEIPIDALGDNVHAIITSSPDEDDEELNAKIEKQLNEEPHTETSIQQEHHDASPVVTSVESEDADGTTTVTTETFSENGVTTVRTTTVTKHPDGSESTHVREETISDPITVTATTTGKDPEAIEAANAAALNDLKAQIDAKFNNEEEEIQEGDEVETHSETFTDENGVSTTRTITIIKHADGSESRRVREETLGVVSDQQ